MKQNLRLIFTSDIHGYFFTTDYMDKSVKPQGLLHLSSMYNKDENTLIIDGGDMLQGSPFTYFSQLSNAPEKVAQIMNHVGYDFITIGNHDFNYGYDYFKSYLNHLDAECICENCFDKGGNVLYPYRVITMKNGLRVGIVGCVTEFVNLWERKENLNGVVIGEVFQNVKRAYEEIKDKVDVSICVYHGGFECDLDSEETLEVSGENLGGKICRELGFDILLTGHQHMKIEGRYFNGTYIVQNMFNALSFHEVKLVREDGENHITSKMILSSDIPLSHEKLPFIHEEERVQAWLDNVVGYLDEDLLPDTHINMALNGSKLADFINKIQMDFTEADISSTSFPNKVAGLPKEVTIRDILLTYPFPNTLVLLEISGKNLKRALERSAEYFYTKAGQIVVSERFLKPKVEHYNYDYFLGVEYKTNYEGELGNRIYDVKVNGKMVNDDDTYKICLNSYRATGAGGYDMYKECKVLENFSEEIFEILLTHIS